MSISHLPPSKKALAQAEAFVEEKRQAHADRAARLARMWEGLAEDLEELGINKIQIGDATLDFSQGAPFAKSAALENHWSSLLAQGKEVGMITAGNLACGYWGSDKVRMKDRSLQELIDVDLIRQLAPSAVMYGPKDVSPWPDLFGYDFSIWVESKAELAALWNHGKAWMKTAWHDDVMNCANAKDPIKYPRAAEDVFHLVAVHDIAPDLSWRQVAACRAEKAASASSQLGECDISAQAELKKALGALAGAAVHPVFGSQIESAIQALTPLLAQSMEGKARHKKLEKAARMAQEHVYSGYQNTSCEWRDLGPAPFARACPRPGP